MNFLSREPNIEGGERLSFMEDHCVPQRWISGPVSRRERARQANERAQNMRKIGLALCVVSAAITIASATWIAVGF